MTSTQVQSFARKTHKIRKSAVLALVLWRIQLRNSQTAETPGQGWGEIKRRASFRSPGTPPPSQQISVFTNPEGPLKLCCSRVFIKGSLHRQGWLNHHPSVLELNLQLRLLPWVVQGQVLGVQWEGVLKVHPLSTASLSLETKEDPPGITSLMWTQVQGKRACYE